MRSSWISVLQNCLRSLDRDPPHDLETFFEVARRVPDVLGEILNEHGETVLLLPEEEWDQEMAIRQNEVLYQEGFSDLSGPEREGQDPLIDEAFRRELVSWTGFGESYLSLQGNLEQDWKRFELRTETASNETSEGGLEVGGYYFSLKSQSWDGKQHTVSLGVPVEFQLDSFRTGQVPNAARTGMFVSRGETSAVAFGEPDFSKRKLSFAGHGSEIEILRQYMPSFKEMLGVLVHYLETQLRTDHPFQSGR